MDDEDRLPVTNRAAPAMRVPCFCSFVDSSALDEQRSVQAGMSLRGRDEVDCAMTMLVVVPLYKCVDPMPGGEHSGERPTWMGGPVFHRSKERFRERVVVADRGAAERGRDAQRLQSSEHRGPLHWAAVEMTEFGRVGHCQHALALQGAESVFRQLHAHRPLIASLRIAPPALQGALT